MNGSSGFNKCEVRHIKGQSLQLYSNSIRKAASVLIITGHRSKLSVLIKVDIKINVCLQGGESIYQYRRDVDRCKSTSIYLPGGHMGHLSQRST
jgi:hypothetical protein